MCSWTAAESDMVVKNRLVGFLLWQSILCTFVFLVFTAVIATWRSLAAISISFFSFHLSQLLFSVSLSTVLSTQHKFRLNLLVLLAVAAVSGYLSALSLCGVNGRVGFKGFASGSFYAFFYVWKRRWVLQFPIIQRPSFFSFKMGIPSAITQALKLSAAAHLFSALLLVFLPHQFNTDLKLGNWFAQHIISYAASFSILLCWELTHHLYQVQHTRRFIFAPPKGSAAAETNPSEPLLAALEESSPTSLLKYLAYLDLCMVCEKNVDYWRRAAFFEETGETYRRVAAVCLRPLEQFASKLVQDLEGSPDDKAFRISDQLQSSSNPRLNSKCFELLNDFQLYSWSARAIASLTANSLKEDRFGVAQLSGGNASVVSTLIACLLAVETLMGKKSSLQPSQHLTGSFSTKAATFSTGGRYVRTGKRRDDPLYSKAYAMADVLRTSIYCIVSAFHHEMLTSAKAGLLEKDWISSGKPPFGTRELLLQKLQLFLDFQAS